MRRLGIIRLERLFRRDGALSSQSTIINWFRAAAEACDAVGLVVPTGPAPGDGAARSWWRPRPGDRVFALPNASGFARVTALAPAVALQLAGLRRGFRTVLCRAPEHGNFVVFPLLRALGFRPVVWLVADRREMRKVHVGRRGTGARMRLALALSDLNDRVEQRFLSRWPVIANGSELAAYARALAPGRRDVMMVTSTTFRTADLPPRPAPSEHQGPLRVLYVGRLAPDKGLGTLVEALGRVERDQPGALELRLVGWAAHGEHERLLDAVREHGAEHAVRFLGPRAYGDELFAEYRASDLFVLPSPSEGTPRVLVEAMIFGLPIVATRVGGIPDLVHDGENGLLVPAHDPGALAAALLRIAGDPPLRARMSAANHAAGPRHTVESLAERMMQFIFSPEPGGPPGLCESLSAARPEFRGVATTLQ